MQNYKIAVNFFLTGAVKLLVPYFRYRIVFLDYVKIVAFLLHSSLPVRQGAAGYRCAQLPLQAPAAKAPIMLLRNPSLWS
jgi:hypothetical protein